MKPFTPRLVAALALTLTGTLAHTAETPAPPKADSAIPADASCPGWTARDYAAAPVMRILRLYTDPRTGDTAVEETRMEAKRTPLLKTGQILNEYNFGPGSKVQIVVGPPNLALPLHPAPYKESFLIIEGSVSMKLGNGQGIELRPGDMTVMEDVDARIGHGGLTGPCGYVSLNIVPPKP
jgi:mannose-6-phosphate isomerase-like protein (cupin superfamily)